MNKTILGFGLLVLLFVLLFPPVEYTTAFTGAMQSLFGGDESTMMTLRPLFKLEGEEMHSAEIHYPLWAIEMFVVSLFTLALAYIFKEKKS